MDIQSIAGKLKLSYIREHYQDEITQAEHTGISYEEFLIGLLEREMQRRKENGVVRRVRLAKFPVKKYLTDFDRTKYGNEFNNKFDQLETLRFIDNKENIILIGTPGAGKTHYSIGLGMQACLAGKTVLFVSIPNLIIELKEAMSQNQLNNYRKKFERYDLVILDELGYVSFDKFGCEILFNLLSNRNDKGSIIITTNLTFDRWEEIFKDTMLTGAIVDRLAYKAHILDISRDKSHRFEETIDWINSNN